MNSKAGQLTSPKYPKKSVSTYVQLSASSPPPSPILLNAIFIKIIPRGKEFAMMIPRSHGVGNVVAWVS
jgi:hypothetical protein